MGNAAPGSSDYVILNTSHQNFCETLFIGNQLIMPKGDFLGTINAQQNFKNIHMLLSTFFLNVDKLNNKTEDDNMLNKTKHQQHGQIRNHEDPVVENKYGDQQLLSHVLDNAQCEPNLRSKLETGICVMNIDYLRKPEKATTTDV